MIDISWVPSPSPSVQRVDIGLEAVLVRDDRANCHVLDPVAAHVWRCLDGTTSIERVVTDLAATFDGSADRIRHDVIRLVSELAEKGLVIGPGGADSASVVASAAQDLPRSTNRGTAPVRFLDEPPHP
ncbi:MAG: PqqD family protein [Acidimicrobiia bacterium]|nr:PqqD family protein [Acidimicrobiia bacterium]